MPGTLMNSLAGPAVPHTALVYPSETMEAPTMLYPCLTSMPMPSCVSPLCVLVPPLSELQDELNSYPQSLLPIQSIEDLKETKTRDQSHITLPPAESSHATNVISLKEARRVSTKQTHRAKTNAIRVREAVGRPPV